MESRLETREDGAANARAWAVKQVEDALHAETLVRHADPEARHPRLHWRIRRWAAESAARMSEGGDPWDGMPGRKTGAALERLRFRPHALHLLRELQQRFERVLAIGRALYGDVVDAAPELAFGHPEPLTLDVAGSPVRIRGRLDRVRVARGPDGATVVEVLDYKTGGNRLKELKAGMRDGTRPQLLLYALVLDTRRWRDWPFAARPTTTPPFVLAYDFVRDPQGGLGHWLPGFDGMSLEHYAQLLAVSIDRTRQGAYPLVPHPSACPHLVERGHNHCPFVEACRFRGVADAEGAS